MVQFTLNGAAVTLDIPPDTSLLHALRGPAGLSGPRFGCGTEGCGACMVLVEGVPAYACTLAASACAGKSVTTVEGLGTPDAPHPLQAAVLAEQAGQCGYCLSGILVSAAALLAKTPDPDEVAIRAALDPHLCRCGSHNRIVRAVRRAAREMAA
ncbi:(2Fe-2S)-binding protein [Siccirubricoccus sp. KC 17139]|uniref:(2Fe-2S)-binding protein n=1 Tax=Siccirubricoccus soli TaxID=2899147 RepID=A0ABT1D5U6_9PROT|nr:(2Fe-2S)-binding protein [Siccirubricoccus soli]MCO6417297.1 (2Fe-2S)-binding protein [Siccirubricoccus soli]MCP2683432.1 (2Fe-2S)-binding protein [Siccirubricoccus soli]